MQYRHMMSGKLVTSLTTAGGATSSGVGAPSMIGCSARFCVAGALLHIPADELPPCDMSAALPALVPRERALRSARVRTNPERERREEKEMNTVGDRTSCGRSPDLLRPAEFQRRTYCRGQAKELLTDVIF